VVNQADETARLTLVLLCKLFSFWSKPGASDIQQLLSTTLFESFGVIMAASMVQTQLRHTPTLHSSPPLVMSHRDKRTRDLSIEVLKTLTSPELGQVSFANRANPVTCALATVYLRIYRQHSIATPLRAVVDAATHASPGVSHATQAIARAHSNMRYNGRTRKRFQKLMDERDREQALMRRQLCTLQNVVSSQQATATLREHGVATQAQTKAFTNLAQAMTGAFHSGFGDTRSPVEMHALFGGRAGRGAARAAPGSAAAQWQASGVRRGADAPPSLGFASVSLAEETRPMAPDDLQALYNLVLRSWRADSPKRRAILKVLGDNKIPPRIYDKLQTFRNVPPEDKTPAAFREVWATLG